MKNVSFKSVYAIPHNNTQNPMVQNYMDFMTQTATLRDADKKSKYDTENDVYYVYIRDENDKKFEDYASRYGINYRKANQTELNIMNSNSKAAEDMRFLTQAIRMGAAHDIVNKGNLQCITLFDEKSKNVFAKYLIDKSKGDGGALVLKKEALDGKTDCIHKYDENGNYKKSFIISDRDLLEFSYTKDGQPVMHEIKDAYTYLQKICKENDIPADFIPEKYRV